MTEKPLPEDFEAFFEELLAARAPSEVDPDKVVPAALRLFETCFRADAMLAFSRNAETPDEAQLRRQLAMGMLAGGLFKFLDEAADGAATWTAAKLLLTTFSALVEGNVVSETIAKRRPATEGAARGDSGEAPFAQFVRVGAVTAMVQLEAAGMTRDEAAKHVATEFNRARGLFAKFKAASGRRGAEFKSATVQEWYQQAAYSEQDSLLGWNVKFVRAQLRPGGITTHEAKAFARDMARHLADDEMFAVRPPR